MTGMLKYGAGMPFNRIERLQAGMGIAPRSGAGEGRSLFLPLTGLAAPAYACA